MFIQLTSTLGGVGAWVPAPPPPVLLVVLPSDGGVLQLDLVDILVFCLQDHHLLFPYFFISFSWHFDKLIQLKY